MRRTRTRAVAETALEFRQEPLPKAHYPYEWTGWPLFERYGLVGAGRPSKSLAWKKA